jgi:hypothetical protein
VIVWGAAKAPARPVTRSTHLVKRTGLAGVRCLISVKRKEYERRQILNIALYYNADRDSVVCNMTLEIGIAVNFISQSE